MNEKKKPGRYTQEILDKPTQPERALVAALLTWRKQHGLTSQDVATMLGVSAFVILSIEKMKARARKDFRIRLMDLVSRPPPRVIVQPEPGLHSQKEPKESRLSPEGTVIASICGQLLQLKNRITYLENRLDERWQPGMALDGKP